MEAPQRTQKNELSFDLGILPLGTYQKERKISWKTILPPLLITASPTIVKNRNNLSFYQLVNG